MMALAITGWLVFGIASFFLARYAMSYQLQCKPVTVGTILGMLVMMWVPPLSLMFAIMGFAVEACDAHRPFGRFLRRQIADPCKWFQRKATP